MIAALSLSALPSWILVALALTVAWRVTRGGGGTAISELSKANEVLERRVAALGGEIRDLKVRNAELTSRTDFSAVISGHERRAQERHMATLAVLGLIAERLGPEPPT